MALIEYDQSRNIF